MSTFTLFLSVSIFLFQYWVSSLKINITNLPTTAGNLRSRHHHHERQNNLSRIKPCNAACSNLNQQTHDGNIIIIPNSTISKNYPGADDRTCSCRQRRRRGQTLDCLRTNKIEKSCGKSERRIESIQNGAIVNASFWPWHVSIFRHVNNIRSPTFPVFTCSGSLISTSMVLTAAHCVTDIYGRQFPINSFEILLGNTLSDYPNATFEDSIQILKIKSINISRYYNVYTYDADIALMSLEKNITLTESIQPICYSKQEKENERKNITLNVPPSMGFTTGFGINEFFRVSKHLKEAIITIVEKFVCEKVSGDIISETQFCGAGLQGVLLCQGNSGAGLYTYEKSKSFPNGHYILQGIVSHTASPTTSSDAKPGSSINARCNNPDRYIVFTNVLSFSKWINSIVLDKI